MATGSLVARGDRLDQQGGQQPALNRTTTMHRTMTIRTAGMWMRTLPAGENIGSPVTATDRRYDHADLQPMEGPTRTCSTSTPGSGQIRTKSPLNHEDPVMLR